MTEASPTQLDLIKANFGAVWPVHVSGLISLMIRLRAVFRGDLDLMLIMAVIGDATIPSTEVMPDFSYAQQLAGEAQAIPKRPINPYSIAEYTGIPRETVRRKLAKLQAIGWVEQRDSNSWVATPRAAEELRASTEESLAYLARLAAVLPKG